MNNEVKLPATRTEITYAYVAKDSSTLNLSNGFIIKGKYDIERLKKAVQKLYEKHDVLRMTVEVGVSSVYFFKHDTILGELEIVHLKEKDRESRYAEAMEDANKRIREDVLSSEKGLYRFWAYELTDDELIFIYFGHHIATDAMSMGIINEQLELYYENPDRTDIPESASFEEFVLERTAYYQTDEYKTNAEYWQKSASCCEHPSFPLLDEEWKDKRISMDIASRVLSLEKLNKIARENRTSNFNSMLLILRIALMYMTGKDNLPISYLFNGRTNQKYSGTVGFLAQIVDFSIDIPVETTWKEASKMVRKFVNGGVKYISASDCIPPSEYVLSYMPMNNTKKHATFAGMERQLFIVNSTSNYDYRLIGCIMTEMETESGNILYYYPMMNINIYGEKFTIELGSTIECYIDLIAENPEITIQELLSLS